MSSWGGQSGGYVGQSCRLVGAHLGSTNNTTVFTAAGYPQVLGVRIANITASSAAVTVRWFSAAANDQFCLLFQHVVPGNGAIWLPLEGFALDQGDEIRVQASVANALDVIVTIAETPGRSG